MKSETRSPKSSLGVARAEVLACGPAEGCVSKTTEYTEHTEKRLFPSVYSLYSVVTRSGYAF